MDLDYPERLTPEELSLTRQGKNLDRLLLDPAADLDDAIEQRGGAKKPECQLLLDLLDLANRWAQVEIPGRIHVIRTAREVIAGLVREDLMFLFVEQAEAPRPAVACGNTEDELPW